MAPDLFRLLFIFWVLYDFVLGMTELLYLIACTFSGTSLYFCEAEIQGIEVPAKKQASAKIDELVISQIKEIRLQSVK